MAVDDLWFSSKRLKGPDGKLLPPEPTKRHGRGKRWRVRYLDDTGKPRQKLFARKPDAEVFEKNVCADVSRGVYVDPAAGKTIVSVYEGQWRGAQLHRGSTSARAEQAFRLHINPILGHLQLAQVRSSQVQAWAKDRAKVLAPSTLHVVYGLLAGLFAAAVRDRLIGVSPCVGVRLPDVERVDRYIPSVTQVHALAEALPDRYSALVYLGAGCGPRQGEAWGLELEHVDFMHREIRIVQQLVTATGRAPFLAPPKTPTSKRSVELGQVVAEALARHLELFPPVEVEIDDETDPRRPVRRLAKLVFLNGRGDPIRRTSWSPIWTPAVAAAGLPEGFGFHGLRHLFATTLIHAGASVTTVQKALGHSKPSITLDTYAGQWPDAMDRTRNLIDAAFGRPVSPGLAVAR